MLTKPMMLWMGTQLQALEAELRVSQLEFKTLEKAPIGMPIQVDSYSMKRG